MRIGFFKLDEVEEKYIREHLTDHELYFSPDKLSEESLPVQRDFDIVSVFVDSMITEKVLDAFPNLKMVSTNSVGFDHIDIAACKKRGIVVAYVPGYGNNTVAEFAFGLVLNLTRRMYQAIEQVKKSGTISFGGLRGIDVKGRTMGIIGTGRIGKEMAKISKGFGMNVIAFDIFQDLAGAKDIGYAYVTLEELLKQSDIISIHCLLTDETRHLLNKNNIGLMKKGAYLVNTARGPIVETDALIWGLQNGVLAGVGLDVLEEEREMKGEMGLRGEKQLNEEEMRILAENRELIQMPNVLITPHNAFNTKEALQRIVATTVESIMGFANKNQNPKNFVV
ncbi:hydroxyacid dehydrogenase [bacterium]|nr:MAG: hydroxyacid dehydrogenase [bacterium]